MKKIVLIAILFTCFNMKSQDSGGIIAGYSRLSLNHQEVVSQGVLSNTTESNGYFVGVYADIELIKKFHIQPEIHYNMNFKNGESINTIDIPVFAKYCASDEFSIIAGPSLNLILDATSYKKTGYGLTAGIIVAKLLKNTFITARYTKALTNSVSSIGPSGETSLSEKLNYFHLGVGIEL